uniref:Major intrinsic family protein n=1 Tax=Zygnema circumcarinatum TaxID=35869 RepID=A0A6M3SND8_ZYGCR|nr:major intrinsic family protein [Zygnema circumcarinatum]
MLNFILVEFEVGKKKDDLFHADAWRAATAEFVATFLFVFVGCGAVVSSGTVELKGVPIEPARLVAISLAHGLMIALLAGTIGSISGGHINPAVTFAFVVSGRLNIVRGVMYVIAQCGGAILGAGVLKGVVDDLAYGHLGAHGLAPDLSASRGFVLEVVLSFVLIFTIFGTAVDPNGPGMIAPILIGFAIMADHLVGVPLTGASMNPARSLGPAVWTGQWAHHWVYWAGPFVGAFLAAMVYVHVLNRGFRCLSCEPTGLPQLEGEKEEA